MQSSRSIGPVPPSTRIPMLIGGTWTHGTDEYDVIDPYRGERVCRAPLSSAADLDRALVAAVTAAPTMADMPALERAAILRRAADLVGERARELADTMAREMGKAVKDGLAEVARCVTTLRLSAEEAVRIEGEHVPLNSSAMGNGRMAFLLRFPLGVVAAITPFNAPINLACHKVAPALAAGNAVVLKAPPQCPAVIHRFVECLVEAGVPSGALNVLYGANVGPALVQDPRVDFITFTGSTRAGALVRAAAGLRRVALELGGLGSTIVHEDADVALAASLCANHAMRLAGQSCISVQNVYVHRDVYAAFLELAIAGVGRLVVGDPLDEKTDVGPVVDENAAARIEAAIAGAISGGARLRAGGKRDGALVEPTILTDVTPEMTVACEEIFGPVLTVRAYTDIDDVMREISESRHGLQAGIFTRSLDVAFRAVRRLRVGGVIVNGTSTWRTDQLAFGGVKDSGMGREGPKYAIREMTEQRVVVFNI